MAIILSLLWLHNSNGSAHISKTHYYNRFFNKKYNSLDLMTEHHCPHECSTWVHTCMHYNNVEIYDVISSS
jgi:hypothetical protein